MEFRFISFPFPLVVVYSNCSLRFGLIVFWFSVNSLFCSGSGYEEKIGKY